MILILAGLLVLGIYMVAYGFNLGQYRISDLPISPYGSGISDLVSNVEKGELSPLSIASLSLIAVVGLILLIAELKPPSPRRVRMEKGTYVTRDAVGHEVTRAAEGTPGVLGSATKVKAKRGPGARIVLDANVRRGDDLGSIKSNLQERVQQRLASSGIPVNQLKIRLLESDPRQTKTRVQ